MSATKPYVSVDLDKETLSTIYGWANFVKFTPAQDEEPWDEEDERVRRLIYETLLPMVRGIR